MESFRPVIPVNRGTQNTKCCCEREGRLGGETARPSTECLTHQETFNVGICNQNYRLGWLSNDFDSRTEIIFIFQLSRYKKRDLRK